MYSLCVWCFCETSGNDVKIDLIMQPEPHTAENNAPAVCVGLREDYITLMRMEYNPFGSFYHIWPSLANV